MPEIDEWVQTAMDVGDGGATETVIRRRRKLPVVPCQLCKKPILQPYLAGSSGGNDKDRSAGVRLKLEPEAVVGGTYFINSKTAHVRRESDLHPSFKFYNEHHCIAETERV